MAENAPPYKATTDPTLQSTKALALRNCALRLVPTLGALKTNYHITITNPNHESYRIGTVPPDVDP